jgi:hypothetical protein
MNIERCARDKSRCKLEKTAAVDSWFTGINRSDNCTGNLLLGGSVLFGKLEITLCARMTAHLRLANSYLQSIGADLFCIAWAQQYLCFLARECMKLSKQLDSHGDVNEGSTSSFDCQGITLFLWLTLRERGYNIRSPAQMIRDYRGEVCVGVHRASFSRYPRCGSVMIYCGWAGSGSSLTRRRRTTPLI